MAHVMSAEDLETPTYLGRSDALLGVLKPAGGGPAPGHASLFAKMTHLVKGG
jgi:hypothetical protein